MFVRKDGKTETVSSSIIEVKDYDMASLSPEARDFIHAHAGNGYFVRADDGDFFVHFKPKEWRAANFGFRLKERVKQDPKKMKTLRSWRAVSYDVLALDKNSGSLKPVVDLRVQVFCTPNKEKFFFNVLPGASHAANKANSAGFHDSPFDAFIGVDKLFSAYILAAPSMSVRSFVRKKDARGLKIGAFTGVPSNVAVFQAEPRQIVRFMLENEPTNNRSQTR